MPKIVLLGATGYTGDLTARSLTRLGSTPLLAARRADAVRALADELGPGVPSAVADINDPASVRALLGPGDVLISTVGPFARWGSVAAEAAIEAGAHYLDSTGEGSFIRDVFQTYGPRAEQAGIVMLTAMGYDWVPGNLAGAVAVERGGASVAGVLAGYFNGGTSSAGSMSGGTKASSAGAMFYPSHSFTDGNLVIERTATRTHDFGEVDPGVPARAFSIGSSEAFSLPRVYPQLCTVDVYLGWNDPDKVQAQAAALEPMLADESTRARLIADSEAKSTGSTGGPDEQTRAQSYAVILAEAIDEHGDVVNAVRAQGANGYDFTADFLALAARGVLSGEVTARGAVGPVEAFGVPRLTELVAEAGIHLA